MSGLMVGDVAVLHSLVRNPECNGMYCIIVGRPHRGIYPIDLPGCEQWTFAHKRNLRKRRPPATDESHQAMLDCIERAKRGAGVEV